MEKNRCSIDPTQRELGKKGFKAVRMTMTRKAGALNKLLGRLRRHFYLHLKLKHEETDRPF